MNTKVWYLPYFRGVYHTRMIETFSIVNAHMVHYGPHTSPHNQHLITRLFSLLSKYIDVPYTHSPTLGQFTCLQV